MTGSLFLSGGGDEHSSLSLDRIFVRSLPDNANILYIPHANYKQAEDYAPSIQWLNTTLASIDPSKHIAITCPNNLNEIESLDKYDAIYIGGGNTYYLLDRLIESQLIKRLSSYYSNGGTIYGGSAGAIICGGTIATAPEERIGKNNIYTGLDLLGHNISLACHYDKKLEYSEDLKSQTIICLQEDSSVIVQNNVISSAGHTPFKIELA